MSALPLNLLVPICVTTVGTAQVLIEFIRARTTKQVLREALRDASPQDRPAIVAALAQPLQGGQRAQAGRNPTFQDRPFEDTVPHAGPLPSRLQSNGHVRSTPAESTTVPTASPASRNWHFPITVHPRFRER